MRGNWTIATLTSGRRVSLPLTPSKFPTLAITLQFGKLLVPAAIVTNFIFTDFVMFLCPALVTNVGRTSPQLIVTRSQVFVTTYVVGFVNVVPARWSTPMSILNFFGMLELGSVSRSRTVVAVVDIEIVLTIQILDDVVATVER